MDIYTSGFRKYEIIKLLNNIKKTIKRVEENVPTQIDNAINQLLDGAPEALDTLKELSDALGGNPNFLTELNNKIDNINIEKDWNQNDENADDYIKNRTHYIIKTIYGEDFYHNPYSLLDFFNSSNTFNNTNIIIYNEDYTITYSSHIYIVKQTSKYELFVPKGKNSNQLEKILTFSIDVTYEEFYNTIYETFKDGYKFKDEQEKFYIKTIDEYHKLDSNYLPNNINDSIMLKETAIPSGGFEANKFYQLGEITQNITFTLKTPTNNNILNKYIIQFSIGSTVPNITWPSNIKWENGSAPTINTNKEYLLKVINNLAQIKEF